LRALHHAAPANFASARIEPVYFYLDPHSLAEKSETNPPRVALTENAFRGFGAAGSHRVNGRKKAMPSSTQ
jgi:hypothetical protein